MGCEVITGAAALETVTGTAEDVVRLPAASRATAAAASNAICGVAMVTVVLRDDDEEGGRSGVAGYVPIATRVRGQSPDSASRSTPDGALASFPLAALPGKRPGSYLIEDLAIDCTGRKLVPV